MVADGMLTRKRYRRGSASGRLRALTDRARDLLPVLGQHRPVGIRVGVELARGRPRTSQIGAIFPACAGPRRRQQRERGPWTRSSTDGECCAYTFKLSHGEVSVEEGLGESATRVHHGRHRGVVSTPSRRTETATGSRSAAGASLGDRAARRTLGGQRAPVRARRRARARRSRVAVRIA